jgi:hypothetical protein
MFTEPLNAQPWELWIRAGALHHFIAANGQWLWPWFQSIHYLGFSLLLGTVGLFDLRVLGMARQIAPAKLHRLIPFGIAGFAVNLLTGIVFISGFPEQYFYNPSFQLLVTFVMIAGVNAALFYVTPAFREVDRLEPGEDAPFRAKLIAGTSLSCWIAVLICGRLITFFRPPFFH